MNLPYPPTDNLYKFMAISGVLLFVLAWVPLYLLYDVNQRATELEAEYDILGIEQDQLLMRIEDLKSESKNFLPQANELIVKNDELRIKGRQLKAKLEKIKALHWLSKILVVLATFVLVGSVALAWVGFNLWYTRVQIHLDREYEARGGDVQLKPARKVTKKEGKK